jgi:hypothetical protein
MQHTHHLVIFVGENVAMPNVTTGLVKEHANFGDLVRKCRDNVLLIREKESWENLAIHQWCFHACCGFYTYQGTSLDISGFLAKRGGIVTAGRAVGRKTTARVHNLFPGTKFTVVLDDTLFRDVDAIVIGTNRCTSIVYNLVTTDDLEMNQV